MQLSPHAFKVYPIWPYSKYTRMQSVCSIFLTCSLLSPSLSCSGLEMKLKMYKENSVSVAGKDYEDKT